MTVQKPTRIRFAELDEELQVLLYRLATHAHDGGIVYPGTQQLFYDLSVDSDPLNNPYPGKQRIDFTNLDLSSSPALQNLLNGGISSIPASITGEILKYLGFSTTAPDGVQLQYECVYQVFPNSEVVFIQGVRQQRGVDYNITGNVVTFTTAPPANPFDPTRPILIDYEPMSPAVPLILPRYLISEFPILTGVGPARTYSLLLTPIQEGLDTGGLLTNVPVNIQTPLVVEQVYHLGNRLIRGVDYNLNIIGPVRNIVVSNAFSSAVIVDYQPAGALSKLNLFTNAATTATGSIINFVSFTAANQVTVDKTPLGLVEDFDTNSIQIYYNGKRLRAGVALDYTVSYTTGNVLTINFSPSNVSPPISTATQANNLIIDFQVLPNNLLPNYKYFTKSMVIPKPIPAVDTYIPLSVPPTTTLVNTFTRQPQLWLSTLGRVLLSPANLYTIDYTNKRIVLPAAAIPTLFGAETSITAIVDYQVIAP